MYELRHEKPVIGVCDQVRLKPACSTTGTSYSLEILDLANIGIILFVTGLDILSLMGVNIGNIGFCIFILICVLENNFWKQKLLWNSESYENDKKNTSSRK